MAQEHGLGVMPWSPLKSGFLSGKYSRHRTGAVDTLRSGLVGGPSEKDYDVIDVLETVAAGDRCHARRGGPGLGPPAGPA